MPRLQRHPRTKEGPLHVLVTADIMSGSWSYTRELVTGLVTRGVRVTLVTFGEIPLPDQTAWMDLLHGLEYRPTAFRLEWMDDAPNDLAESSEFLCNLVREVNPDLLHVHQFCHGDLAVDIPRVVMANGDLISWTEAVQGCMPRPTNWLKWYYETIVRGIAAADAVVAPSACMLNSLISTYRRPRRAAIIYPGRNPIFFNPYVSKEDSVLSVGRLLDAGKQVFLLTQHPQPLPVCIVGAEHTVTQPRIPIRADVKLATDQSSVAIRGAQTDAQLRALYSRAAVYAATPRYEPLGIAPLEAAFSRCAIVANDIPTFREFWGDSALYFRTNDARHLAETLRKLSADRAMRHAYADRAYARARDRFTTKRMIDDYLDLYRSLVSADTLAA
jgi:glycosyltransferase involved in cell wall biosynthesis